MPNLAALEPSAPAIEQKPVKHRKPTKKLRHAIDLIMTGECSTYKAAAERSNMSREWLSRSLREVHVQAYIERQTRASLAVAQAPAAARLISLLDAQSEHVQKDVAIHLLGIAGHKPANTAAVSVNIDIKAGYVIDLSEAPRAPNPVIIDAKAEDVP
jgi:hypothetical protein